MYNFSVDYNSIDKSDLLNTYKYLMTKNNQVFIVLLSFSESLATKVLSLNDKPCMVRPTLYNLSSVELKYYLFIISLDNCSGRCMSYRQKCAFQKKQKP